MADDTSVVTQQASREQWTQARRKAFWQRLYRSLGLSRRPVDLLSFEEVQAKLRLNQSSFRGLQIVPLDQIVGSVGRYNDFTRTFLPLVENDSYRWRKVAELQAETGLPPIELYKVGDAYFVKDGNHRVSVARQFNTHTIEAFVWEYETPVGGVSPDAEIDDLIVKAEYRAFLDRTRLDLSHPGKQIILTEPGMYPALELEIELYRENLQRIDDETRTYQEAASAWYELAYSPAIDIIRESEVLRQFPGRTESDLYVWLSRHRKEMAERYGEHVSLREAVAELAQSQQRPSTVGRVMQSVGKSVADFVHSLTSPHPEADTPLVANPDDPLGRLLMQVRNVEPRMAYAGQRGDEWRWWRGEVRGKLRELLGLRYSPTEVLDVEFVERNLLSGVQQEKILLTAADGIKVPGYVMRPVDLTGSLPALLVYPGHGTIRQTAGLERSLHQANALALAQAGFVTVTLEARGVGELAQVDHVTLDNIARMIGRTWLGMVIEDGLRAVDYLQSRRDVQSDRIGVTGLGLGGGLALYTAALDERLRAVVVQNYMGGGIDPLAVLGHACDFVPNLRSFVELGDIARLIVPRPALYAYPRGRSTSRSARAFFDKMRPTYEVFGCPDRTRYVEHEHGDDYDGALARDWVERWLVEEEDPNVLLWAPRE